MDQTVIDADWVPAAKAGTTGLKKPKVARWGVGGAHDSAYFR